VTGRLKLISFADGPYRLRATTFAAEATAMKVFDDVDVYDLSRLSEDFRVHHGRFIETNPRGFGYWIWKPHILIKALQASSEEDVVFYIDVGSRLNPDGRARLLEYAEIVSASPHKMLSFSNTHTEKIWTKMDLLNRLGIANDPTICGTSQLTAGFIILCPTQSNLVLCQEWQAIAVEDDYRFSNDLPSSSKNCDQFQEHRHDQSISSVLRKMRGTAVTHYESQPYDNYYERYKPMLPVLAQRLQK
jgi:hypothetical protein